MTLYIACILIYHAGLSWHFHALAVILWLLRANATLLGECSRTELIKSKNRLAEAIEKQEEVR